MKYLHCVLRIGFLVTIGFFQNNAQTSYHSMISKNQSNTAKSDALIEDEFTKEEIKDIINLHNELRGNVVPPAANMEYMTWDDYLAETARKFTGECNWRTDKISFNLYRGNSRDPKIAIRKWFEESKDYNLYKLECKTGKSCRNYTQIVWAKNVQVGCSIKSDCWERFTYFIACYYSPNGNFKDVLPYLPGKPCSVCDTRSSGGLCYNNLCIEYIHCLKSKYICECKLDCYNCAKLNDALCRCECPGGYDLLDCSRSCMDRIDDCEKGKCNDREFYTGPEEFHPCRKTCNKCSYEIENNYTCCGGMCKFGYVYRNEISCECELLCPGLYCEFAKDATQTPTSLTIEVFDRTATIPPISGSAIPLSKFIIIVIFAHTFI